MSDMPNVFGNDFLYRLRAGRLPAVGEGAARADR